MVGFNQALLLWLVLAASVQKKEFIFFFYWVGETMRSSWLHSCEGGTKGKDDPRTSARCHSPHYISPEYLQTPTHPTTGSSN